MKVRFLGHPLIGFRATSDLTADRDADHRCRSKVFSMAAPLLPVGLPSPKSLAVAVRRRAVFPIVRPISSAPDGDHHAPLDGLRKLPVHRFNLRDRRDRRVHGGELIETFRFSYAIRRRGQFVSRWTDIFTLIDATSKAGEGGAGAWAFPSAGACPGRSGTVRTTSPTANSQKTALNVFEAEAWPIARDYPPNSVVALLKD